MPLAIDDIDRCAMLEKYVSKNTSSVYYSSWENEEPYNSTWISRKIILKDMCALCTDLDKVFNIANSDIFRKDKIYLCAYLAAKSYKKAIEIFPQCIENVNDLKDFVDVITVDMKRGMGHLPGRMVRNWFNSKTPDEIFDDNRNVGYLRNIIRMCHVKPLDKFKSNLFKWILNKDVDYSALPTSVKDWCDHIVHGQINSNLPDKVIISLFNKSNNEQISLEVYKLILRSDIKKISEFYPKIVTGTGNMIVGPICNKIQNENNNDFISVGKIWKSSINYKINEECVRILEEIMDNAPDLPGNGDIFVFPSSLKGEVHIWTNIMSLVSRYLIKTSSNGAALVFGELYANTGRTLLIRKSDSLRSVIEKVGNQKFNGLRLEGMLAYSHFSNDWVIVVGNGLNERINQIASEWNELKSKNSKIKMIVIDCAENVLPKKLMKCHYLENMKDVLYINGIDENFLELITCFLG